MANPYITQATQMMPEQQEQAQIIQQRKLAEALQQQGMESPQGQMVSGIYVAPSMTQYLAQGLKGYLGGKGMRDADEKQKALAQALMQKQSDWMAQMPSSKETIEYGGTQDQPMGPPQMTKQNPTSDDYLAWGLRGIQINPAMAQMGVSMADRSDARRMQQENMQAQLQARRDAQAAQIQAQREAQAQRAADQANMARLAASLRPAPAEKLVTVMGPEGMPVQVPVSQASGMTPFNAQTIKLQGQMKQKEQAAVPIQQALDQAAAVYAHPGKGSGTGMTAWMQNVPATDAKAFGSNLNTFKAQSFLSAVESMKGLGALTEAEGKKLVDSVGSLDPYQSTKDFDSGIKNAARYLYNKAKASGINVKLPEFANEAPNEASGKIGGFRIVGAE